MANFGVGGLASAFQVLEISHTHFWTRDMLENMEAGLVPSAATTAPASRDASPYSSRENLASLTPAHRPGGANLRVPGSHSTSLEVEEQSSSWEEDREGRSRSASQDDKESSDAGSTAEMLRELIQQKKSLLLGRLASLDSEAESDVCRCSKPSLSSPAVWEPVRRAPSPPTPASSEGGESSPPSAGPPTSPLPPQCCVGH